MAFGISGFGGSQAVASPQVFQALSLAGKPPVPPAPPYGTPNPNLVPVAQTGNPAFPANLTLAAHATFQAILRLTNQSVIAYGHPPFQPSAPNTTTGIATTNPAVGLQIQGPTAGGLPSVGSPPEGPVSFGLTTATADVTSGLSVLEQSSASLNGEVRQAQQALSQQDAPSQGQPQTQRPTQTQSASATPPASNVPVSQPAAVSKIVQTVQTLAVSAVYGGPVFSFNA